MSNSALDCDTVVIGAGIAGLAAAAELTRRGRTVVCLEARDRIGGRAWTVHDSGSAIDLGATWFWPHETMITDLVTESNVSTFEHDIAGNSVFEPVEGGPVVVDGNPLDARCGRFRDGAHSVAVGLAQSLPESTICLSRAVLEVDVREDRVTVHSRGGRVVADSVIVAVPPALAVATITFTPALDARFIGLAEMTSTWMGSVIKAVAVFDHAFWRAQGLSGSALSQRGPFREFHDLSGPAGVTGALFGFAQSSAFDSSDAVGAAFREQLTRLFGHAARAPRAVFITDWSREVFTVPPQPSSAATTASYGHDLFRIPAGGGRIHWAGTETDSSHPGHLEGALRSGRRAARAATLRMAGGISVHERW